MFALICGYLPFEDPNTANLYKKILNGDFQIPKFVSNDAKDLLKCILCTDPIKRFRIEEVRKHAWYNQVKVEHEPEGIIIGYNTVPVSCADVYYRFIHLCSRLTRIFLRNLRVME
jgi:5'-AMP-activated protein kinase catalytic alpha subunit